VSPTFTDLRQKRVAALAVFVEEDADKARAVWIILDSLNNCRDLLVVRKINIAEEALVSAALVAHGDAAALLRPMSRLPPETSALCGSLVVSLPR
jgi:hypothetical protein